jgi:hypothetical protein
MAKEEKKDKFGEMIDMYKTESSVDGKKKREEMERRIHDTIEQAAMKYLIKKRGEHETEKGTPKSYSIEGHDEAHEMVVEMAKSVVKHKYPGIDVKLLGEQHLMELLDAAVGHQGYAHQFISHLADHGHNVLNDRQYTQIKGAVASHLSDMKLNHAKNYLTHNKDKRGDIEDLVNKELGIHEKELKKGLKQESVVEHLGAAYEGSLTKEYVEMKYPGHFKKAKPKK